MIASIDILVPILLLVAILLSSEPKRSAITVIIFINLSITAADYFSTGWITLYSAALIEIFGAVLLAVARRIIIKKADRDYFYLMSAFLMASAVTVPLYSKGIILDHGMYVFLSETVAMAHIIVMICFTDGIRTLTRNIRDSLSHRGITHSNT